MRIENASATARVGTIRKPPPTPKKPVIAPTSKPAVRTRASRRAGQLDGESWVAGGTAWCLPLRDVAAAAASMMTAKAASSARPLIACPSAVPAITPGIAAVVNPAA
jgi:hypothetical protein